MFKEILRFTDLRRIGFFALCCCLSVLSSCNKTDAIGLSPSNNLAGVITDTVTINTSTYLLDSIPTAGNGLMIGHVNDQTLGTVFSQTYFQIVPESVNAGNLPDDATLDSTALHMKYSGFWYGDTSVTQDLAVHQLSERIVLPYDNGIKEPEEQNVFSGSPTFYNISKFKYDAQTIGTLSFKAKPTSKDTLLLPLQNTVGASLMNLIKQGDIKVTNTEEFLNYFKGLTITAGSNGNSIIGYTDTVKLKLYYHYTGTDGLKKNAQLTFALYNNSYQFNNISSDRNGTPLSAINLANRNLPASQSNNNTFVQAGVGLVTRINLPYLSYISERERGAINKAELVVEVEPLTERTYDLPKQLVLLVANRYGKPMSVLSDPLTNTSSLPLRSDPNNPEKYYYSFPLTEYVSQAFTTYNNTSLFLSLPVSDLGKSFSRAILGSPENAKATVKLKITYTNLNL